MTKVTDFVYRILASSRFFLVTVLLLVVQSVWLAFTAIYPLPFDEYYHIGVIKIYANQWSPFITQQPPEASLYGDITRMSSFLYHYLMSFPYRVLDVFIANETALVISMRLLNIAFVVGALFLFRKLFMMWKIPKRVMHVVFLLFVFTPIVPFVAAHVNYDNFVLLMMPVVLIFGTRLIIDKGDMAWNGVWYMIFGLTACAAKETFVPLFAVITAYVAWRLWVEHGMKFWRDLGRSFDKNIRNLTFLIALFGLGIVGGLVGERYVGNYLRYDSFRAECEVVQPESVCEKFGPWYRNRENLRKKPYQDQLYGNPVSFTQHWISKSMRGFFVPFSHTPTHVLWEYEPYGPIVVKGILPVGFIFACVALVAGLIALALKGRDIFRDKPLRFAFAVCAGYLVVLWLFNYKTYLSLGEAEAIQARYSYPILLLLFLLMIKSANDLIASKNVKAGLVIAATLLFVWGGGIAPWLVRADSTWRWQNPKVQQINDSIQDGLKLLIIH